MSSGAWETFRICGMIAYTAVKAKGVRIIDSFQLFLPTDMQRPGFNFSISSPWHLLRIPGKALLSLTSPPSPFQPSWLGFLGEQGVEWKVYAEVFALLPAGRKGWQ